MSFEFILLDALQALRCPVLDALAVFFDQAGAHGEIWIAFTVVLLAFRRTRRAGLAMALALGLYMLAGHCALKPLFARPRPATSGRRCSRWWPGPMAGPSLPDTHPPPLPLPLRSGCRAAGLASRLLCWPGSLASRGCTCMCISPPTFWAAWHWALHWGPAAPCWQIRSATNGRNAVK